MVRAVRSRICRDVSAIGCDAASLEMYLACGFEPSVWRSTRASGCVARQSVRGAVGAVVAFMHSFKARLAFAEPLHFRAERVHCCAEAVHRCLRCPSVGIDACCASHDQHRQPDAKGESGPDYRADDGDELCGEHGHGGYHLLCKLLVEVWILSVPLATGYGWFRRGYFPTSATMSRLFSLRSSQPFLAIVFQPVDSSLESSHLFPDLNTCTCARAAETPSRASPTLRRSGSSRRSCAGPRSDPARDAEPQPNPAPAPALPATRPGSRTGAATLSVSRTVAQEIVGCARHPRNATVSVWADV